MDHGELPPKKKKKKTKKKAVAFEEPAAPAPAPEEQAEEEEIGWGAFCDALELDRRLARAVAPARLDAALAGAKGDAARRALGPRLFRKRADGLGQDGLLCVTGLAEGAAGQGVRCLMRAELTMACGPWCSSRRARAGGAGSQTIIRTRGLLPRVGHCCCITRRFSKRRRIVRPRIARRYRVCHASSSQRASEAC